MYAGSLRYAGNHGYYWASTAYPSELSAYNLTFGSATVYPSHYYDRWGGFTVQAHSYPKQRTVTRTRDLQQNHKQNSKDPNRKPSNRKSGSIQNSIQTTSKTIAQYPTLTKASAYP